MATMNHIRNVIFACFHAKLVLIYRHNAHHATLVTTCLKTNAYKSAKKDTMQAKQVHVRSVHFHAKHAIIQKSVSLALKIFPFTMEFAI